MNKYEIVLGDWSGDGHSISERYLISTNKTNHEITLAYEQACQKVGWNFHDLCEDYEDNVISTEKLEQMESVLGMNVFNSDIFNSDIDIDKNEDGDGYCFYSDSYLKLLLAFIKSQDPDLILEVVVDKTAKLIVKHCSFGYGLFNY